MNFPMVKIIILNWNGWQDTIECLESIFQISYPNYQIIVVDNGSTDGSAAKIRDWAEGKGIIENNKLVLIEQRENLGFARGNNVGIRYALDRRVADYILILNNDTVVAPDFLTHLVENLEKCPRAVLAAPQVIDYYRGTFWQSRSPSG